MEVSITSVNAKQYENLGYNIPRHENKAGKMAVKRGTKIIADTNNLPKGSCVLVDIKCDYCGIIYQASYSDYYRTVVEGVIHKACCIDCAPRKRDESNLLKYGVKNQFQREEIKVKSIETNLEKYGVAYNTQRQIIKQQNAELRRLSFDEVLNRFNSINLIPLIKENDYKNVEQKIPYACNFHKGIIYHTSVDDLSKTKGCPECRQERTSGENHHNWNGGVSSLNSYLRDKIKPWIRKSESIYDGKCVLTGDKSDTVHHLYGFNLIRDEVLQRLRLDIKTEINMYSDQELKLITWACKNLHIKRGLGVPLKNNIHDLFHNLYGRGDNTPEQFEEFKIRYRVGEFDELLIAS